MRTSRNDWPVLLGVAGAGLVAHFITAGNYGIFRDELYYLDCARHLAWGYVDHPPLSIFILWLSTAVFGDSVWAIRILPAVAGALLVIITGLLAARFGGDRFAVFLAALAALVVPVYLINTGFFSLNAFELLFWALLFLLLADILTTGEEKRWLPFGIVLGLAALNKVGIAAFVAGLVPALLLTRFRTHLKSRYFWLGALISALIFVPHILWQVANDWPTAEFVRNAQAGKIVALSLPQFFTEQILMMNPALLVVWLLGLGGLLFWHRLRDFRVLGIIWLGAFLFFGLQRSKPYYLSPGYPPLLAAGAVILASWFKTRLRWLRGVLVATTVAGGLFVAPMALPILSPESLLAYLERVGINPSAGETGDQAALPQYFADRFGWENMARTFSEAYHGLPHSLRNECAIITRNYGEAGAVNYYRDTYDLPPAYSQHNSHYLWGTGDASCDVILAINYSLEGLRSTYDSVKVLATVASPWAMPYETDTPIYLCTGLRVPWEVAWRSGKLYY